MKFQTQEAFLPFTKVSYTTPEDLRLAMTSGSVHGLGTAGLGATAGGVGGTIMGGLYNMMNDDVEGETPEAKRIRENRNRLRGALLGAGAGGVLGGVHSVRSILDTKPEIFERLAEYWQNKRESASL